MYCSIFILCVFGNHVFKREYPPTPDDGRGSASEEHLGDGRACAGFWCRMPAAPLPKAFAAFWGQSPAFKSPAGPLPTAFAAFWGQ